MMPTVEMQSSALARVVTASAFAPAAFTMIELLVVLLIMSIVAAVAAPTFHKSLGHHRLESAARRVKQDLEYLRDTARAKSTTLECEFGEKKYTLDPMAVRHLDRNQVYEVDLSAAPYDLDDVDFGGATSVAFNGYGDATDDDDVLVTLWLNDQQRRVRVQAATGLVKFDP